MADVPNLKVGIIGDFARVEGGIHINGDPTNPPLQLPRRPEHFTGRQKELTDLLDSIRPGHVVTLWGPGGIGKSALAAEALWRLTPDGQPPTQFPDGILWHDFYKEPEAALALEHIARSFDENPEPSPRDAAMRALSGKKALLLLDGAEDADDLDMILSVAGGCGVIITSRKRKDGCSDRREIETLAQADAADLLKAWGRNKADDEPAMRRICDLVGGLPLAVCLAGSYLDQTGDTAGEYLRWLKKTPLDALNQGDRKSDSVSILLRRSLEQVSRMAGDILSVCGILAFKPFGPDAISSALNLSPEKLKRPFNELTGYGLIDRNGPRYQLKHALVHTYVREKHPPPDETVQRLSDFFVRFTDKQIELDKEGYVSIDKDRNHIIQVLIFCKTHLLWKEVRALVWSLDHYLGMRGYWTERRMILKEGIEAAKVLKDPKNEGKFRGNLGLCFRNLGNCEKAIKAHELSLSIARKTKNRKSEGYQLGNLGLNYRDLGQLQEAIEYHQKSLSIAKETGNKRSEGHQLAAIGIAYSHQGHFRKASTYYRASLAIAREIGNERSEGHQLGNIGRAYCELRQIKKGMEFNRKSLAIAQKIGNRTSESEELGNIGFAHQYYGQYQKAILHYQQALAISRKIGNRRLESDHLCDLGFAYEEWGQTEKAIGFYQQALGISQEIGYRRGEGIQLSKLGLAYQKLGQIEKTINYLEKALIISQQIGNRINEGLQLSKLGLAYSDLGQVEKANELMELSIAIVEEAEPPDAEPVRT